MLRMSDDDWLTSWTDDPDRLVPGGPARGQGHAPAPARTPHLHLLGPRLGRPGQLRGLQVRRSAWPGRWPASSGRAPSPPTWWRRLRRDRHDRRAHRRAEERDQGAGPAGSLCEARGGRRGRDLARLRRRGVRHRGGHPGRRRPRHGALQQPYDVRLDSRQGKGRDGHPRRQDPGGRGDDGQLHRLRDGRGGPGAGRHGAHLQLRAGAGHHQADRQAASGRRPGAGARRDRPPSTSSGSPTWFGSTSTASTASCTRSPTATPRPCSAAGSSTGRGRTWRRPSRCRRTPSSRSPSPAARS